MRPFLCLTFAMVVCLQGQACFAQRRGPSPERMFRFLDRNRDGVIRGEEWDRFPSLSRVLEEQEIDPERGMRVEEFQDIAADVMSSMRDRGRFRGRDSRDRGSRSRDDSEERDFDRRRFRARDDSDDDQEDSQSSRFRRNRSRDRGNTDGRRNAKKTDSKTATVRPRINPPLPSQYKSRDTNGDGQIGLYEWPRDDFAGFARLDFNGDGFLTPRELHGPSRTASATEVPSRSRKRKASPNRPPTRLKLKPVAEPSRYQRAAEFSFRALDRNKDGIVAADEWGRSRTTKPLFEKAGIDITQTMSREKFIATYIRLRSQPR